MKEKLPLSKQIAYALGQFGWSLLSGIIGSYLIFYYIPTKESGIMTVIPQVAFLGFLTIIGLITMIGRLFDAVTDPWIATLSDRSKSKKGRPMSNLNATKLESDANPVSRRDNVDVDMLRQPGHRYVHRRHQRMTHNPGSSWDNDSTSSPLFEQEPR